MQKNIFLTLSESVSRICIATFSNFSPRPYMWETQAFLLPRPGHTFQQTLSCSQIYHLRDIMEGFLHLRTSGKNQVYRSYLIT